MVVPVLLVVLVVPVLPDEPVVLVELVLVELVLEVEEVPDVAGAVWPEVTVGVEVFDVPEVLLPVLKALAVLPVEVAVVVGVVEAVPPPQPANTKPVEARTRANFFFGIS